MKIFSARQFEYGELDETMLNGDPFVQFDQWYKEASKQGIEEPNAMSLATVCPEGAPSVRTVYMKYYNQNGIVFFTNYTSQKAQEINKNPLVETLFYWKVLGRQIRVFGRCEKVSKMESLKYFVSRPRESQLGAWCSNQSSIITSRSILIQKLKEVEQKFKGSKVPLPDAWGGYRIVPFKFEFWQGRKSRIHDRFIYTQSDEQKIWKIVRLAP